MHVPLDLLFGTFAGSKEEVKYYINKVFCEKCFHLLEFIIRLIEPLIKLVLTSLYNLVFR